MGEDTKEVATAEVEGGTALEGEELDVVEGEDAAEAGEVAAGVEEVAAGEEVAEGRDSSALMIILI